jgi:aspartate aminotransferase/aminotransferase
MLTTDHWIAERLARFDSSGIRKMFELAAQLKDPINLSIGEPDFDVPPAVKQALIDAIQCGRNSYAPPQGIAPLREELQQRIDRQFLHADRKVMITSGTSGGLTLLMLSLINPGDEVVVFDPYFVLYVALIGLVGGIVKPISTYPDFQVDLDRVRQQSLQSDRRMLGFRSFARRGRACREAWRLPRVGRNLQRV